MLSDLGLIFIIFLGSDSGGNSEMALNIVPPSVTKWYHAAIAFAALAPPSFAPAMSRIAMEQGNRTCIFIAPNVRWLCRSKCFLPPISSDKRGSVLKR
jgi:hypothetical protein